MSAGRRPSSTLTSFVVASRFMPVFIAIALLVVGAMIWAPNALTRPGLFAVAAFGTFLALAALGQMLVIMTGGIDLSTPGTFTLAALIMVGVGQGSDERIWTAVATAVGVAAVIGLVNGILIAGLRLNALIVTLAVGQVVIGLVNRYDRTFSIQSAVPPGLNEWALSRHLGMSAIFWVGVAVTLVMILAFRYAAIGRRFQAVGANPVAARVTGLRVTGYQVAGYVAASVLYAIAGILLAGFLRNPGVGVGAPYLLGPIAAVVIGGAALSGGLASPLSTWAAAMFLAGLNQVMRVMGLPTALQFVVFGLVIIGGMLVSGDRITRGVEQLLRERRRSRPSADVPRLQGAEP